MSYCTFCYNSEGMVYKEGISKYNKPWKAIDCPKCKKRTFIPDYIQCIEEWEHLREEELK